MYRLGVLRNTLATEVMNMRFDVLADVRCVLSAADMSVCLLALLSRGLL